MAMRSFSPGKRILTWLRIASLVSRESLISFFRNNDFDAAATLAYYGFFSLMPLLLLMMMILSRVMYSSQQALSALESVVAQLFPQFTDAILRDVYALSQQSIWGVVTIIILFWSITPFAAAFRAILVKIHKTDLRITFLKARILDIVAVLAVMLVVGLLVVMKIVYAAAESSFLGQIAFLKPYMGIAFQFPVAVLCMVFFYRVFSPKHPGAIPILAGSTTATVLLFIIRPAFSAILQFNPAYGFAFGSLKAIFLLIIWVYYSFVVILFGAEIMANVQRRDSLLLRRLFNRKSAADTADMALLEPFLRSPAAGSILFREGDPGDEMYYVLDGSVLLSREGTTFGVMRPGDYFGEMSMLIGAHRTATVTIGEPGTRLVAISTINFETILRENPAIVRKILEEMARRLKKTNDALSNSRA